MGICIWKHFYALYFIVQDENLVHPSWYSFGRMGSELFLSFFFVCLFLVFLYNSHAKFPGNKNDLGILCMLGLMVQDLISRVDGTWNKTFH